MMADLLRDLEERIAEAVRVPPRLLREGAPQTAAVVEAQRRELWEAHARYWNSIIEGNH